MCNYRYLKNYFDNTNMSVFLFSVCISLLLVSPFLGLCENILLNAGHCKLKIIEVLNDLCLFFFQRDSSPYFSRHIEIDSLSIW